MRMEAVFIATGEIVVATITVVLWAYCWRKRLITPRFWSWSSLFLAVMLLQTVVLVVLSMML